MIRFVVLSCLLALVHGGKIYRKPMLDGRIVGGERIDIKDAPYHISLHTSGVYICGGSLIGTNTVLTAAHCTDGAFASDLRVRIGSSQYANGGALVQVSEIIQHPQYNQWTIEYDVSILRLENYYSIKLVSGTVNLPIENDVVSDGTSLRIAGWGVTQDASQSNKYLRAVTVVKINQSVCNEAYSGNITPRMICAGVPEGGKDACQGDSGGGLVDGDTIVGIVSWGYGCALKKYPGVYTNLADSEILDFINKNKST